MFRLGLSFGEKLRESLTLSPVETFPDLMERVEQHAKLEDESNRESHRGGQRPYSANVVDAARKKVAVRKGNQGSSPPLRKGRMPKLLSMPPGRCPSQAQKLTG